MLLNSTYSIRAYIDVRALLFAYLARDRAMPVAAAAPADPPGAEFFPFASPRGELLGFIERAAIGWRARPTIGAVELEPLFGDTWTVVPATGGAYKFPGESGSSIRFTAAADGTPIAVIHGMYAEAAPWWPARIRAFLLSLAIALMQIAPVWSAMQYAVAALSRRRPIATDLLVWPALATVCLLAANRLMYEAAIRDELGECRPFTIAVCALTIAFGLAATAGMFAALRWAVRPDRPSLATRLVPSATAICAFAIAVWFALHGLIGIRTWDY